MSTTKQSQDRYVIIQGSGDEQIVAKVLKVNKRSKSTQVEHPSGQKQWLPDSILTPVVAQEPNGTTQKPAKKGDDTLYGISDARAYIGEHIGREFTVMMYKYHRGLGRIPVDGEVSSSPYHYKSTLDAFIEKWRADGLTLKEAAAKYELPISTVRFRVREDDTVQHIGKRGRERVYDPDDIARLLGQPEAA